MSDAQKGQTCMRARRTHERPGVARRTRLTIDQQHVRSESKNNENKKNIDKKQLKLGTSTKLEFLRQEEQWVDEIGGQGRVDVYQQQMRSGIN